MLIVASVLIVGIFVIVSYWQYSSAMYRNMLSSYIADNISAFTRGISVVVACPITCEQICNLLKQSVSQYEVVVACNFAGREHLLDEMVRCFALMKVNHVDSGEIPDSSIVGLYRSRKRLYSRLIVVMVNPVASAEILQIAASVASHDYILKLHKAKSLQHNAIQNLLFEIESRPQAQVERVRSMFGERFLFTTREWALMGSGALGNIPRRNCVYISYRINR